MKILHIINSLATGGAEKLLLETLPLYNKKGISVDLLVLNGSETSFLKNLKEQACCNIYSLGTSSVYNPLNSIKLIPYLKGYKVVHVHLFPAQYWVVFAKLFSFSKVKIIFTEHSTSNRRIQNKFYGFLDYFVYRYYDAIICITSKVKSVVQKHTLINSNKLIIIENGISIDKFLKSTCILNKDFFNEENVKLIIQVSSFQEPKDQKTVIESLQFLPSHIKLLLVGEGHLKEESEKLVKILGVHERVRFLGVRMDVPQLLKTADIIVLSSKYEGLSLSSIEGMAAGRAFIASDVPGLTEVVKGAGVLFEQGNAEELAEKIISLLDDKVFYDSVSEACLKRASQYDIRKMVDQHIALYESIR